MDWAARRDRGYRFSSERLILQQAEFMKTGKFQLYIQYSDYLLPNYSEDTDLKESAVEHRDHYTHIDVMCIHLADLQGWRWDANPVIIYCYINL